MCSKVVAFGAPTLTESDSSKVLKGSFQRKTGSFLLSISMFKSKVRARMSFSTLVPALILFSPLFAKFKNSSIEVFKSSGFIIRSQAY